MRTVIHKCSLILDKISALVTGIILVALCLIIDYSVVMRFIFDSPVKWQYELTLVGLCWATFIGMPMTFHKQEHLRLTFVTDKLKPATWRIYMDVIDLLLIVFLVVGIINSISVVQNAWGQLYQTIPANKLKAGTYRVTCQLWCAPDKKGTTRLFAGNSVQYFGKESDYTDCLTEGEEATFAGYAGDKGDNAFVLKNMEVTVHVGAGESLTLGIRSSNLKNNGTTATSADGTGWFKVDNFRIEKVEFSPDHAIAIYVHFANALEALANEQMQDSIYNEVENVLKQNKVDDSSTQQQITTAFLALKDMYAKANHSVELYKKLYDAYDKGYNKYGYKHCPEYRNTLLSALLLSRIFLSKSLCL
jgi:TRAP-type C4-dicarboxylate transport system permease small subunit